MGERVTTDQIKMARTVDIISYMKQYEPEELIRTGPHDYKTATHSSLCISDNGLWHWYSRGIGGCGALNYLIQVTATILMVDTNVQREHILPSEKAKAYKMKLEAMKRKAGSPSVNCTPFVRQYDILNNKWGALLCRKEYQTNAIHQNSRSR